MYNIYHLLLLFIQGNESLTVPYPPIPLLLLENFLHISCWSIVFYATCHAFITPSNNANLFSFHIFLCFTSGYDSAQELFFFNLSLKDSPLIFSYDIFL